MSKMFAACLQIMEDVDAAKLRRFCMSDVPTVEDLAKTNKFMFKNDIVDGVFVRERVRRSIDNYSNAVMLLRDNNVICYNSNINAHFKIFCGPSCDQLVERPGGLETHLTTSRERFEHTFLENVYKLRQTLFGKLDAFDVQHADHHRLFNNNFFLNSE